ncbi:Hypothetical predicted protein [Paramuricea clavata]|uniref:Uncharacterized protein n=1 Tax=Paramuricea clavata TaxID=317549 RepID=A0A7D9MIR4_PARCT|nr:Hypothetical predicted protein [Paramuricea clavata]
MRKEHEFRMEEMALEYQQRREDREHEMNLLRLLVHPQGPSPYPINPISNPMPHNYPSIHTPLPANTLLMLSTSGSYDNGNTETDSIGSIGKKTYFSL